jgi:hypothetical protein
VKVILHNAFYAGLVKHKDELYQGAHEPLISKETFDLVEANLIDKSIRSHTIGVWQEEDSN